MPKDPFPMPFEQPWEYEISFPRDPRGPKVVRAALYTMLTAHHLDPLIERAALLTSELTTNSVRYSDHPVCVRVRWEHPVLRVSVSDSNPELPAVLKPGAEDECGRGLFILEVFADRWGGFSLGKEVFGMGGKTVWFELGLGDPPPIPALAA
ncbi:ATP-binding protein [Streptomyces pactum]|uniref:ATP-binding protein n=1 Tax=Streptomyces pactum TaxID=68249 RepID=A0ABS0NPK3_9ACTN|nr:ATP-binding protein [Streptomyces pactum]MBH5337132.1 ATP-binding protein [Streptomyces pactum]